MANTIGPFSTATQMLAALDAREVSSVELTELHLARLDELDGALNAVPVRTPERAMDEARAADAARASSGSGSGSGSAAGGEGGTLLGLPMTVKESTQVAGLPQSAGITGFAGHVPAEDGLIARSLSAAGVCLLGKTNIPVSLADWQADSPVYGRTNNPWDLGRTPGGSTGGGGAALAAGMTPLEIGSDIGGSIRVPAAYCGVYGHRPSETAVPRSGAYPLSDRPSAGAILGVQGPLARSADDLELLFDMIAGPDIGEDAGWQLALPPARHERLADFRVAIMPPTTLVEPSSAMQAKVAELADFLGQAGAKVSETMPAAIDQEAYLRDYLVLMLSITSQDRSPVERERRAARLRGLDDPLATAMADALLLDSYDLQALLRRRADAQATWRAFFSEWDVLVCPTALDAAFEHQSGPQHERVLDLSGRAVPYMLNIIYPMWAIFPGLPATAFPAGTDGVGAGGVGGADNRGLPLGLQAIGPYLEDRTTLRFAQLLEREWHAFEPPPGY